LLRAAVIRANHIFMNENHARFAVDKSLPSNQARVAGVHTEQQPAGATRRGSAMEAVGRTLRGTRTRSSWNVFSAPTFDFSVNQSMAMADRSALRLIGILFATVTIAVMSTTVLVVKGQADANYLIENTSASMPLR
jgi:hypothetical protein